VTAVSAILLAICGYRTVVQQRFYANDEVFYQRAVAIAPDYGLAKDYLGNTYIRQARLDLAMVEFREAYRLALDDPHAKFALASGLFKTGDHKAAESLVDSLSRDERQPYGKMPVFSHDDRYYQDQARTNG